MFEKVNPQHPDKVADRIAGAVVDLAYTKADNPKIAVEVLLGHGECTVMIEASVMIWDTEVEDIVHRIAGNAILVHTKLTSQDIHLANNQQGAVRCGDNGIFKGSAPTHEQKLLTAIAASIYDKYPHDGKYLIGKSSYEKNEKGETRWVKPITICQSHLPTDEEEGLVRNVLDPIYNAIPDENFDIRYHTLINPLGEWTGGPDVDCGATNRKLGSDMGDGVTGGGLHGKDLSKADVSVNIWCYLESIRTGHQVTATCSIGDETVKVWSSESSAESHSGNAESRQSSPTGNGIPYSEIVEKARLYILTLGGFEKFSEWGLIRAKDL